MSKSNDQFFASQVQLRTILFVGLTLLGSAQVAYSERRLVNIGGRQFSIDCDGESSRQTIVLIAGQGRTAQDWAKVQTPVSAFARVCSYDRAGLAGSDKSAKLQSLNEIVEDLHKLLIAAGEKGPYILVGHSIAGIYCRRFAKTYPNDVSGLVFLDSSHEEQMWRLHEIDPKGPVPSGAMAELYYPQPGQKLDWETSLPMIVIAEGKPGPPMPGLSQEQNAGFGRVWRELQEDLAKRSPKGQFRIAERSGHFIQIDEPDLVVHAIRELVQWTNAPAMNDFARR